jgi:hypothetical protein
MIVCRKCSRRHPDGTDFCACGAFLEFDGEHVADEHPAAPVASPEAPVDAGRRVSGDQVRAPAGTAAAPWSGFGGHGNWTDTADPIGVQAQLPDEPGTVRSPDQVVVQPSGRAGDISCPRCGTSNAPERQFCQHCGQALSGTVAVGASPVIARQRRKVPWWRRLTGRIPDNVRTTDPRLLASKARRLSHGGLSTRSVLFRSGGVMVILAALLAFLPRTPWNQTVLRWSRDRVGITRYEKINVDADQITETPNSATPQEFPLQGPENLVDGGRNTAWATGWLDRNSPGAEQRSQTCEAPPGTDSWLVITFPQATDLDTIQILGGRANDKELDRDAFLRPRFVQALIDNERCVALELPDDGQLTGFKFEHDGVRSLELKIVGVHEAAPEASPTVEISELIFKHRRR